MTTCGDGLRAGNEQCDDENVLNDDGCSENCEIELGFTCNPVEAYAHCGSDECNEVPGDGITVGGEVCDDGNFHNGDGCKWDGISFQLECGFLQVE